MTHLPNVTNLLSGLVDQVMELLGDNVGSDCGSCDIPPPCWYPREAGHASTPIGTGGVATITLKVKNGGPEPRTIRIRSDADVRVEPANISLIPMEQTTVIAILNLSALKSSTAGAQHVVWVVGGQTQYVLWDLVPELLESPLPTEFDVVDQPEYLHHWYDHFYCERPPARPWTPPDSFKPPHV